MKQKNHLRGALAVAMLVLVTGCGKRDTQNSATFIKLDPDFNPMDSHPFSERCDEQRQERLSREELVLQGDSLGFIRIERAEQDSFDVRIGQLSFLLPDGASGSAECAYNEFKELTTLLISTSQQRIYSRMDWDEAGNIAELTQEIWDFDSEQHVARHQMSVYSYEYSNQSAYGNWVCGMAELLGGPVATAFHAGLMGRSPWLLPNKVTEVTSVIEGNMIGGQKTLVYEPKYELDNNGRVLKETFGQDQQTMTYKY